MHGGYRLLRACRMHARCPVYAQDRISYRHGQGPLGPEARPRVQEADGREEDNGRRDRGVRPRVRRAFAEGDPGSVGRGRPGAARRGPPVPRWGQEDGHAVPGAPSGPVVGVSRSRGAALPRLRERGPGESPGIRREGPGVRAREGEGRGPQGAEEGLLGMDGDGPSERRAQFDKGLEARDGGQRPLRPPRAGGARALGGVHGGRMGPGHGLVGGGVQAGPPVLRGHGPRREGPAPEGSL